MKVIVGTRNVDAELFDAMLTVNYHTGYAVAVEGRGTHGFYNVISARGANQPWEFVLPADQERFLAWAKALRNRKANAPMPEPDWS